MTNLPAAYNLTDSQVKLASTFIARVSLDRDYRMVMLSERYQRMLDLVRANIDDPMIAGDIGVADMVAITAYFLVKRNEFLAKGL